jgi:hypothetical protein
LSGCLDDDEDMEEEEAGDEEEDGDDRKFESSSRKGRKTVESDGHEEPATSTKAKKKGHGAAVSSRFILGLSLKSFVGGIVSLSSGI